MEPTRHKELYVTSCLNEIRGLRADVDTYHQKLMTHIHSLEKEIHDHLWVTPDFSKPAAQSLEKTREEVEALLERVDALKNGFENLPREEVWLPLSPDEVDEDDE